MIPQFPQTKKLELSDREEVEAYIRQYGPYSDFNFVSMWCYDTDHKAELSKLNGNLVLKFQDYIDLEMFYTFLGTSQVQETVNELLDHAVSEGIKPYLQLVPHTSIKSLIDHPRYVVKEDQNNFDYIIDANEFSQMAGSKYHKKRNMVSRFRREYGESASIRILDIHDAFVQHEIIRLFHVWEQVFHKTSAESQHELVAIYKLFDGIDAFTVTTFGVEINGVLEAFLIADEIQDGYAIRHFEKPNVNFHGITEYLQHESARYFAERGCIYINYEQDLGLPGLREAKTLCHPAHFLKKYLVMRYED